MGGCSTGALAHFHWRKRRRLSRLRVEFDRPDAATPVHHRHHDVLEREWLVRMRSPDSLGRLVDIHNAMMIFDVVQESLDGVPDAG